MSQSSTPGIVPHLSIPDNRCQEAMDYYCRIFDGKIVEKKLAPDNKRIIHAEIKLGNGASVYCNDEFPEHTKGKTIKLQAKQASSVTLNLSYLSQQSAKKIWSQCQESGEIS